MAPPRCSLVQETPLNTGAEQLATTTRRRLAMVHTHRHSHTRRSYRGQTAPLLGKSKVRERAPADREEREGRWVMGKEEQEDECRWKYVPTCSTEICFTFFPCRSNTQMTYVYWKGHTSLYAFALKSTHILTATLGIWYLLSYTVGICRLLFSKFHLFYFIVAYWLKQLTAWRTTCLL